MFSVAQNQTPCNLAVKLGPFSPLLFPLVERCAFGAGELNAAGVFRAQSLNPRGSQRQFLALRFQLSVFSVSAFCFEASRAACAGSAVDNSFERTENVSG